MKERRQVYVFAGWFMAFVVFTLFVCFFDVGAIGPNGTRVGFAGMNGAFHQWTGVGKGWKMLSKAGVGCQLMFVLCYCVEALRELVNQHRKLDRRLICLFGLFALAGLLDQIFGHLLIINCRPVFEVDGTLEASYPSSHTLLGMTCLGGSWIFLNSFLKGKWTPMARRLLGALHLAALTMIVVGRAMCGVHWLTDIMGGILLSGTLLALFQWVISSISEQHPL